MNQIDTRGYSCPEPVLMTKAALKNGTPLSVLCEEIPCGNITRVATKAGYKVSCKDFEGDYELTIE